MGLLSKYEAAKPEKALLKSQCKQEDRMTRPFTFPFLGISCCRVGSEHLSVFQVPPDCDTQRGWGTSTLGVTCWGRAMCPPLTQSLVTLGVYDSIRRSILLSVSTLLSSAELQIFTHKLVPCPARLALVMGTLGQSKAFDLLAPF